MMQENIYFLPTHQNLFGDEPHTRGSILGKQFSSVSKQPSSQINPAQVFSDIEGGVDPAEQLFNNQKRESRCLWRQVGVVAKADKQSWELRMVRALVEQGGEPVQQALGEVLAGIEVNHDRDSKLDGGCLQGVVEDLEEEESELAGV